MQVTEQTLDPNTLLQEINKQTEWCKTIIFDDKGKIIIEKNCKASQDELNELLNAYENRNKTIGKGFKLLNQHYDVHRFHPPLIYGRRGDAEVGEGICLCRGKSNSGQQINMIITYELPIVSARAIPQQIQFFNNNIGTLEQF